MTQAEAEWLLAECRRKIDALDLELRELLNARATVVENVVRSKQVLGVPILESRREQEVIQKVMSGNPGPLPSDALQRIFEGIMKEMRDLQQGYLDAQDAKSAGNAE